MSYFVRILTPSADHPPVAALLRELGGAGGLKLVKGGDTDWSEALLVTPAGDEVATVTRDPADSELGREEIREFLEEIEDARPEGGRRFVEGYLKRVKTIYALQVLGAAQEDAGGRALNELLSVIAGSVGGILQADFEGFTNEHGHHVLWQFSDDVEGPWVCAVLDDDGEWRPFEMDLENEEHRRAFLEDRVPEGARPVEDLPDA